MSLGPGTTKRKVAAKLSTSQTLDMLTEGLLEQSDKSSTKSSAIKESKTDTFPTNQPMSVIKFQKLLENSSDEKVLNLLNQMHQDGVNWKFYLAWPDSLSDSSVDYMAAMGFTNSIKFLFETKLIPAELDVQKVLKKTLTYLKEQLSINIVFPTIEYLLTEQSDKVNITDFLFYVYQREQFQLFKRLLEKLNVPTEVKTNVLLKIMQDKSIILKSAAQIKLSESFEKTKALTEEFEALTMLIEGANLVTVDPKTQRNSIQEAVSRGSVAVGLLLAPLDVYVGLQPAIQVAYTEARKIDATVVMEYLEKEFSYKPESLKENKAVASNPAPNKCLVM